MALVATTSALPDIPFVAPDEESNFIAKALTLKWDLLFYMHPSSLRLINTTCNEQALVLNQYPNPSLTTVQMIADTSSILDLCQGLFLEGYKLVYMPNLKFGPDWAYCDRPLHVDVIKDTYPNVLYPLTRFRSHPFEERLACAMRICQLNLPV